MSVIIIIIKKSVQGLCSPLEAEQIITCLGTQEEIKRHKSIWSLVHFLSFSLMLHTKLSCSDRFLPPMQMCFHFSFALAYLQALEIELSVGSCPHTVMWVLSLLTPGPCSVVSRATPGTWTVQAVTLSSFPEFSPPTHPLTHYCLLFYFYSLGHRWEGPGKQKGTSDPWWYPLA